MKRNMKKKKKKRKRKGKDDGAGGGGFEEGGFRRGSKKRAQVAREEKFVKFRGCLNFITFSMNLHENLHETKV
jgi:hypothetical protein